MSAPQGSCPAALATAADLRARLGQGFVGQRLDRGQLAVWVRPGSWLEAGLFLQDLTPFHQFSDLTAVDCVDRDPRFDLVLHLLSPSQREGLRVKTMLTGPPGPDPVVASLTRVWPAANWYEREVYDLFGIMFGGHPDLQRLLLPPDYQGHPLRKDYPATGPVTSAYR